MDREDGWYRITDHDWVRVTDEQAEAEITAGEGWDLVCVKSVTAGMDPLF